MVRIRCLSASCGGCDNCSAPLQVELETPPSADLVADDIRDLRRAALHVLTDTDASEEDVSAACTRAADHLRAIPGELMSTNIRERLSSVEMAFRGCLAAAERFEHAASLQCSAWTTIAHALVFFHSAGVRPPADAFERIVAKTAASPDLPLVAKAAALNAQAVAIALLGNSARLRALSAGLLPVAVGVLESIPPALLGETVSAVTGALHALIGDVETQTYLCRPATLRLAAAVVRVIRGWPSQQHILTHATTLLGRLLSWQDAMAEAVVAAGGLESIIEAMRRFPAEAELQFQGCSAFTHLEEVAARATVRNRIFSAAIAAMRAQSAAGDRGFDVGPHALKAACLALFRLTSLPAEGGADVVECTVHVMRAHPLNADLQNDGMLMLMWIMTIDGAALRRQAAALGGGVQAVVRSKLVLHGNGDMFGLVDMGATLLDFLGHSAAPPAAPPVAPPAAQAALQAAAGRRGGRGALGGAGRRRGGAPAPAPEDAAAFAARTAAAEAAAASLLADEEAEKAAAAQQQGTAKAKPRKRAKPKSGAAAGASGGSGGGAAAVQTQTAQQAAMPDSGGTPAASGVATPASEETRGRQSGPTRTAGGGSERLRRLAEAPTPNRATDAAARLMLSSPAPLLTAVKVGGGAALLQAVTASEAADPAALGAAMAGGPGSEDAPPPHQSRASPAAAVSGSAAATLGSHPLPQLPAAPPQPASVATARPKGPPRPYAPPGLSFTGGGGGGGSLGGTAVVPTVPLSVAERAGALSQQPPAAAPSERASGSGSVFPPRDGQPSTRRGARLSTEAAAEEDVSCVVCLDGQRDTVRSCADMPWAECAAAHLC